MKIRCAMPAGHRPDCPFPHEPETSAPTEPEPYVPPSSVEEYNLRLQAHLDYSGFGLETKCHMPCGFCAAPDWAVYPLLDTKNELTRERTCTACGRSARFELTISAPGVERFEFVQTGGDLPPVWLKPTPRQIEAGKDPAQAHLDWAIDRALEYFDAGDKTSAISSFISDVRKHDGTAWIATFELTFELLLLEYDRGRDAFRKAMTGFSVRPAAPPE